MAENQPSWMGPHEDRELALMLAGNKPLAMFGDAIQHRDLFPEADFAPHVATGAILRRETQFRSHHGIDMVYVFFALPDEAWRLDEALEIIHRTRRDGQPTMAADDIAIGELLGYTESDIAAFVAHVRRRLGRGVNY